MAKVMPFTSLDGVEHLVSYWFPAVFGRDKLQLTAVITFYGYHTADCRRNGAAAIGVKEYRLTGDLYAQYVNDAELDPLGSNPSKAAYTVAAAVLDTPSDQVDVDDNPVLESFFSAASDV